jgi:hypothetical protein
LNRVLYIIILSVLPLFIINGQVKNGDKFIQVSGIISDEESHPVPHVSIISHKLRRGTLSELTGIYSIISLPGDTIYLSALGYKNTLVFVPMNVEGRQFTKDIVLQFDTIVIKDVVILPWKTYEEFKRDMLTEVPMKPEIRNMNDNLAALRQSILNSSGSSIYPEAAYRYAMRQNFNAMSTRNQYPVNNLLNPFAWAKFFNGVKHGLLKNQKSTKTSSTKAKVRKKKVSKD